jgi:hypothetical protein
VVTELDHDLAGYPRDRGQTPNGSATERKCNGTVRADVRGLTPIV